MKSVVVRTPAILLGVENQDGVRTWLVPRERALSVAVLLEEWGGLAWRRRSCNDLTLAFSGDQFVCLAYYGCASFQTESFRPG
jgi:hypothetical protein